MKCKQCEHMKTENIIGSTGPTDEEFYLCFHPSLDEPRKIDLYAGILPEWCPRAAHVKAAMRKVYQNALDHAEQARRPDFHMLAEEVLELSLAVRGLHDDPPEHELVQIGGIVVNWLADLGTEPPKEVE